MVAAELGCWGPGGSNVAADECAGRGAVGSLSGRRAESLTSPPFPSPIRPPFDLHAMPMRQWRRNRSVRTPPLHVRSTYYS